MKTKQNSEILSLDEVYDRLSHTDAFIPKVVEKALGIPKTISPPKYPKFLDDKFIQKLKKTNHSLICFAPLSPRQIGEKFQNKQKYSPKNSLILDQEWGWSKNEPAFLELPLHTGLCIMSNRVVGGCYEKFLTQTRTLIKHVETIFPNLKDSKRWLEMVQEVFDFDEDRSDNASDLVQLQINKLFRPTVSELYQLMILYERVNGVRIYNREFAWTNSLNSNNDRCISLGCFRDGGAGFDESRPEKEWSTRGVPFICSLNEIQKIM